MHVRRAAEVPDERRAFDTPDVPHLVVVEVTLLVERQVQLVEAAGFNQLHRFVRIGFSEWGQQVGQYHRRSVVEAQIRQVRDDLPPGYYRQLPKLADGPRAIIADADRVQQIAWNLLSNAVKFTPPGGQIDVEIPEEPGSFLRFCRLLGRRSVTEFKKGMP